MVAARGAPGRRLLVWHVLPSGQPDVVRLVRDCQDRLAGLGGLDKVPAEWLHMTTQIVGFADEIPAEQVQAMTDAVVERMAKLEPIEVELGKLWFHSEAVMLGVRPARALDPIRKGIREAIAQTVAAHQPADEPDWTPHISVAYSNGTGPAAPIVRALNPPPPPSSLRVARVHLVAQQREGHLYRWEVLSEAPLGG
ncbi:2'-5' RNA ligase family protein [Actinomadura macrotermitis]|uniref:RNA 2',3'-cyclic phosphodiesterase n=1 Tax=Actinomadura macrotermitis TaxID=2585200 RepID=A0A7K0BSC1_9ACTN|nr:2'-5' RNA ligase family protein [Actinomadura macrotermitis]MQY04098.1 RNA 2',3'-cyclic phosphodiesterase [Actinomadura macrotermitis]